MPQLPDWVGPVAEYMWEVGVPGTLRIAGAALVASTVIGMVLGTLLTIRFAPSRALIRSYIEIWRGLPIIVTIFAIYLVVPPLSEALKEIMPAFIDRLIGNRLEFDPFTSATIGLSLWGSAQVAEATRGAVQSIGREQHEAAAALGFGWVGRHLYVILPQAFRRLIPPLVTLLVGIIQNTTLAQVIGAAELLETAERMVEQLNSIPPVGLYENHSVEIYGAVALFFFVISFPLTRLAAWLERRLAV